MDLKGLVHRELGEGMTEEELASAVGTSVKTIADILADDLPLDPAIWAHFARYFRMDADFFRFGGPSHSAGLFDLKEGAHLSPDEEGAAPEVGSDGPNGHARRAASAHLC